MNSPLDNQKDLDALSVRGSVDHHTDFASLRSQKRELLAEQQSRWAEGNPVSPEELVKRWPTDPKADSDVASVLFEDLLKRLIHLTCYFCVDAIAATPVVSKLIVLRELLSAHQSVKVRKWTSFKEFACLGDVFIVTSEAHQ